MVATARRLVDQFIADFEAREIDVTDDIGHRALDAAQQFGKIVNHAAKLNLAIVSAMLAPVAKSRIADNVNDFGHTDLGW